MPEPTMPHYLQSTYDMLKCAYPDGIPDNHYWAVIALLHPHMSYRVLAETLAAINDTSYIHILNDTSGFTPNETPDDTTVEIVRQKLLNCNYKQWLEESP